MTDPRLVAAAEVPQPAAGADSHCPAPAARPRFDESELQRKLLLSIPESAFLLRLAVRTVWRLMADPKSGFPKPRHFRGRTLIEREALLAFLANGGAR